jgi:hypothetical protein
MSANAIYLSDYAAQWIEWIELDAIDWMEEKATGMINH